MHPTAPRGTKPPPPPCHIIFFGEIGSGKSSVINLLLGTGRAPVSNGTQPCTQTSACYETFLLGRQYCLWDTRGLGEGHNFFRSILRGSSEKELKRFLKERHRNREIHLLVYCVSKTRVTKASAKIYNNFCAISRRLAAPVAIVVTRLEREKNMEGWWENNASTLNQLNLSFDAHACITTLPGSHPGESKGKLVDLIIKRYHWEPKESGSYFGSPVLIPTTQSAPPHHKRWMHWNFLKSKYKGNDGDHPRPRNDSGLSTTASSSAPSSPTVEPPTPPSAPRDIPPMKNPSESSSEGISSMSSSPCPMTCTSSSSSRTSQSESSTEEDLPIPDLTSAIERRSKFATHSGGFGDVWECDLFSGVSPRKVAVKAVKTKPEEIEKQEKKLHRELKIWWKLKHRNVVPLLGIVSDFGHLPSMVSPWFSNGSLFEYLTAQHTLHPSERRYLLRDIADGLSYLHSRGVIHGDLHSGNVLIDDDGTARLTDFGLSFVDDFARTSYWKSSICGNVVFADPALVKRVYYSRDIIYPTKPCDVYSFGGLVLHVLSGKKPYAEIQPNSIFWTVLSGTRPQIPIDITPQDELLIQSCWDRDEHNRPSANRLPTMFHR